MKRDILCGREIRRIGSLVAAGLVAFVCAAIAQNAPATAPAAAEQMVEISVEVTEITGRKGTDTGIEWSNAIKTGEFAVGANAIPEVPSIIRVGDWGRFTALQAELKLLEVKGAAQILSKPKLLTKSGTSAKFVVGGEIPIVASAGAGGVGQIQWKEFGIRTEIVPKVQADGAIDLNITTEVSRLDWANQVQNNPAIMKREANANVRIKSGQTVAIAGLVETTKEENIKGIPLLVDLPVVGRLFGRKVLEDKKNNILIFVTPRIMEQ